MKSDGGKNDSIWTVTADVPEYPALSEDLSTNVCIVGAGIAGMTTAYLLAREGKSVVVLDDGPIAGGETGRTTAHLSFALDDRYFELERMHGERGARLAAQSHSAAVDKIEEIVNEEHIDCDFQRLDGYLFIPPGWEVEYLERERDAAQRAGLVDVRLVDRIPAREFNTGAALHFPRQGQFHPVKYLAALARAIERDGGKIYTGTHVKDVKGGVDGGKNTVITTADGRKVRAHHAVVATNTPVNDWFAIHNKQAPYRTYVIGALVPRNSVPSGLYWDTLDPYHYVRLQRLSETHDALIVGGEDHKTGQAHDTDARFDCLEEWARSLFPMIEFIEFRWSGQVIEPSDSLAFIGKNPGDSDTVYIATGDSGHGMTHGTIAGMLITDLIQGRDNPWEKLYDPARKPIHSMGEYARENLNVARQYVDYVTGGDVSSADQIAPGTGAVLRRGFQKIAVYRTAAGEVRELSAICPHMGCVVDWNDTEKSWDCPCHGSRFDPDGRVINGPANTNLGPTEDDYDPAGSHRADD
jgi:glycine/D-amino acid oxidase-like deaminating enzyme/nitrite reductase/ring-hydroxylating ferredoxin subunit